MKVLVKIKGKSLIYKPLNKLYSIRKCFEFSKSKKVYDQPFYSQKVTVLVTVLKIWIIDLNFKHSYIESIKGKRLKIFCSRLTVKLRSSYRNS